MFRIKKILILLVVFTTAAAAAQKFELGKVSVDELAEKYHTKDTSACAAVLFKKGNVSFEYSQDKGFQIVTTVKARIKIYKKEGYEWANQKINYFTQSNFYEIASFDNVATFNLVEGKIVKTKLKSDGEFTEKINKYRSQKIITLPNVKEGSVIEYEYVIRTPGIVSLREWDFQSIIPVNYSEYTTNIPEYFVYNALQKGSIFPKVATIKKNSSINYNYRAKGVPGGNLVTSSSLETLEFMETKTTYLCIDLPAITEEKYINNINNYISSISNELSVIKFPNQPIETFSSDWESVTKSIYDNEDFGLELKKTDYFEKDINLLTSTINSTNEKIEAIFNFVKSKIKWNEYYGYSCDSGVRNAYKTNTGNVAEINLMLTAMLRFAGIDANPVLISTRSNGIALFPTRTAFNYVIAAVEIENGLILLDATEKNSTPNVLPIRDLNWFGRLIRKNGSSSEVSLMPKSAAKEIINLVYALNSEGLINGKLRYSATDHLALFYRNNNLNKSKDQYLQELENLNNNIVVSDYVRENDVNLQQPIVESFGFKDSNSAEIIGNKIYFAPKLFLSDIENPFKQEIRKYPIDFSFPFSEKYTIIIDIPEGYKIESVPEPINLVMIDNIGSFKYNISVLGNRIQIRLSTELNESIIPVDYYETLKDFYKQMIDKQNEKIILVKA